MTSIDPPEGSSPAEPLGEPTVELAEKPVGETAAEPCELSTAAHRGPSISLRLTLVCHGVLLPAILLGMSLNGLDAIAEQAWQSGNLEDYIAMLLKPVAWVIFAPGMIYAMVSMCVWAIAPGSERSFWVRLGIATGVVLSIHFCAVLMVLYHIVMLIFTAIVWPIWYGITWCLQPVFRARRQFKIWHIMLLMTVVAILVAIVNSMGRQMLVAFYNLYTPIMVATPCLNAIAYMAVAFYMLRRSYERQNDRGWQLYLVVPSFIVSYLAAVRYSVLVMLDEYAKLPTTNPNCYMANAAAYAHPRLTGASQRGQITTCIRRMKFLELVVRAVAPGLHRCLRICYDRYGPGLAAICQQHFALATCTCLALKPLELAAEFARQLLSFEASIIARIYAQDVDTLGIESLDEPFCEPRIGSPAWGCESGKNFT